MQLHRIALGLALAAAAIAAQAHGDTPHDPDAPVRKEQKPWGIAGDASAVRRTIDIRMSDAMRFAPNRLTVRQGETVRLRVRNTGQVLHELVIGTRDELAQHATLMKRFPNMEHDEAFMAHVPPGSTGNLVWTFNRPGSFHFACLVPGHYEAGMTGRITVLPRGKEHTK